MASMSWIWAYKIILEPQILSGTKTTLWLISYLNVLSWWKLNLESFPFEKLIKLPQNAVTSSFFELQGVSEWLQKSRTLVLGLGAVVGDK